MITCLRTNQKPHSERWGMTLHHSHCDVFGAENEKNYFILTLKTNLCLFSGVAFVSPQRAVGYTHQQLTQLIILKHQTIMMMDIRDKTITITIRIKSFIILAPDPFSPELD